MRKNVASQKIGVQMVSASDGSAFTGSVTVAVTGDAGTQATGSVGSGACTHEGNGYHTYAPAQAETNYDLIAFTFTGTGAIPATVQVFTTSLNPHDTVRAGLTALPNAAADAAGGLPISDAGGLDLDSKLANTNEVTAARMGALTDWINGGRLDLILDIIAADTTTDIPGQIAALNNITAASVWAVGTRTLTAGTNIDGSTFTAVPWNASWDAEVQSEVADALAVYDPPTNAEMEARTLVAADYTIVSDLGVVQTADHTAAIADLPTNAELATSQASADDATLAAIAGLNNLSSAGATTAVTTALTTALTEAYRNTGATGSVAQLLYEIIAHLGESSISDATKTLKKIDGSTTAKTYTLDSATTPTSITETT